MNYTTVLKLSVISNIIKLEDGWLYVARKNTEPIELKFSSRLAQSKTINRVPLPFQDGGRLYNVITTKA